MNAVERVMATLNRRSADRVAVIPKIWIDLAAGLERVPYIEALRDPALAMRTVVQAATRFGMDGARLFTFPRRQVEMRNGDYLDVDAAGGTRGRIDILGGWATELDDADAFRLEDPAYLSTVHLWRAGRPFLREVADVARMAVPSAAYYDQAGYGAMVEEVKSAFGSRICLIGDCGSNTLAFHCALRGVGAGLADLIDDPELAQASMEKGMRIGIERARFFLSHGIKVLRYNDSIANMSVISSRHWRKYILPPLREFCAQAHQIDPDARIYCHMCGNVLPVMRDLVESGLDCVAPLDPLGNFTVAQARAIAGPEMPLMGGVHTLSFTDADPPELTAEARRCIEEGGGPGRFILGSGCVVPRGARPDNLAALLEAAERFGREG